MNYYYGMFDKENSLTHTEPNMFADSVETVNFLGTKKYRFSVKGNTIIMTTGGKKYAIESKDYMRGRVLTDALEESFFGGHCGIGCTIDAYRKKLSKTSYSPVVKYYLSRMDRVGVPIDFTIIDAIYNCKPVGHNTDIPDVEREHMVRAYIFGLAQSVYEYYTSIKKLPKEVQDSSTIYITAKDVKEFQMIPPMNNVFVSYDMESILKNGESGDYMLYKGVSEYAKTMRWQRFKNLLFGMAARLDANQATYIANVIKKDMGESSSTKAIEENDIDRGLLE